MKRYIIYGEDKPWELHEVKPYLDKLKARGTFMAIINGECGASHAVRDWCLGHDCPIVLVPVMFPAGRRHPGDNDFIRGNYHMTLLEPHGAVTFGESWKVNNISGRITNSGGKVWAITARPSRDSA